MAETIFARVRRIIAASINDHIDALERAGGEGVMREAIREIEQAADDVREQLGAVTTRRLQATRQIRMFEENLPKLNEKATFALQQGREDLAEAAVSRQIDFEQQVIALRKVIDEVAPEERKLEQCIADLSARKSQMESELKGFVDARREARGSASCADDKGVQTDRKAERAEAAFNRAMEAATGLAGATRADAATYAKVTEIDTLRRSAEVAGRMAALKSRGNVAAAS